MTRLSYLVLAAAASAAVLLGGCGGGSEGAETAAECPQKPPASFAGLQRGAPEQKKGPIDAWITLDGYHGPQNVGILMAQERGYFADAGIRATITSPLDATKPVDYVREEGVDFGISHQPEVVRAREEGTPVIAVGALVPQPTAALIWLKGSKIRGIADLKGKTVVVSGLTFHEDLLESALERAGLTLEDVEVLEVGYELVPALVSGRADAIFGGYRNLEGAALEARGLKPVIAPVRSLGAPAYDELVVIARADRVLEEPQLIRAFMSAVARGTAAAVKDPGGAVELIEKSGETDPDLGRKALRAQLDATLPLLSKTGRMDPAQAAELTDWMCGQEMIDREPPTSDLLTNAYLAPQR